MGTSTREAWRLITQANLSRVRLPRTVRGHVEAWMQTGNGRIAGLRRGVTRQAIYHALLIARWEIKCMLAKEEGR